MTVSGLNQPCPACGKVSGDHTLREWSECLGATTTDEPFHVPGNLWVPEKAQKITEEMRRRFKIDEDVLVADHVVIKALVMDGYAGIVRIKSPGLLHEFGVGMPGQPPEIVSKVLFMGNEESISKYTMLIAQSASQAIKVSTG